jgi:beta-glucosidase
MTFVRGFRAVVFLAMPVATCATACNGSGSDAQAIADAGPPDVVLPPAIGQFPAGFHWGTATAAYQVEVGLHDTDWYQWETLCTNCVKERADDGPDFWNHHAEDLQLAADLQTNSVRIGIEWARIFPTRASFPSSPDAAAVARYHEILAAARARGLRVMVTLHHFSTPTWLADLTRPTELRGWEDKDTADRFGEWAAWLGAEFGGEVDWWVTINEPLAYVTAGWIGGVFPPGKQGDLAGGFDVLANLIRGHVLAYDALHRTDTADADGSDGVAAWVSFATHNRVFLPFRDNEADREAARVLQAANNRMFLDAVVHGNVDWTFDGDYDDPGDVKADARLAGRLDYIALQYYGVSLVVGGMEALRPFSFVFMNDLARFDFPAPITDFGTVAYPEGFRPMLDELVPYDLPIVITENGLADADDDQRPRFIIDHLYAMGKAIDDGIDIRGYYHWSLLDNFEWISGFCPRFGLIHVDFTNPARPRTVGEGARVYREIIEAGTVPPALFARYPSYPPPGLSCVRTGF